MEKINWIKEDELDSIEWIQKVNKSCDVFYNYPANEISLKYSYFTIIEHRKFINEVFKKLNINLKGVGMEIGAGPGIFSNSVLSIFESVQKIYLLEKAYNNFKLMTKVAVETGFESKLSCVIGDFNNIKLKENSLDFVLDFDSIHHSENFDITFREISRVLKKDGQLICFDRAQPNYISKNQIKDMLNIEYSDSYKNENGIPLNTKFNRSMNGETEPKLNHWLDSAKKYNLKPKVFIFQKKSFNSFVKICYGLFVPYFIKSFFKKGINITVHYQALLHYFGINNFNNIRTFKLDYKKQNIKSPTAKMILVFKKC